MSLSDTLSSLGVNVSAPAVTNFSSNPNFQLWAPSVAQAANSNGVDPTVALAMVGQESSWNPNAMSSSGAYGLTQSLPSTASQPGYGVSSWSPFETNSNINGGVSYLGAMIDNNGGSVAAGLTDYNGNSDPNYANSVLALAGQSGTTADGSTATFTPGNGNLPDGSLDLGTISASGSSTSTPSATSSLPSTVTSGISGGSATGGSVPGAGTGTFPQIIAWIQSHVIVLIIIIIALVLIVGGTLSLLRPVAEKVAKAIPPVAE